MDINVQDQDLHDIINNIAAQGDIKISQLEGLPKKRLSLRFSKALRYHRWMSWLSVGLYNFCRAHHSLRIKESGRVRHRSPAMAAGLTDHVWTIREWLLKPAFGR
ncbi:hypothetical protein C2W62_49300 [Candidatus Entotheonella serta]|nr:hypothetical protein C2W62_49300 [Candidatus Entotheonella serta]